MIEAVRPGGLILDLQVIKPIARIEIANRIVCELEAEPLMRRADAAAAAIDAEIGNGRLVEEAVDDHDALTHFVDGAELAAHFNGKLVRPPQAAIPKTSRNHGAMRATRPLSPSPSDQTGLNLLRGNA